jgi:hypothetical protein
MSHEKARRVEIESSKTGMEGILEWQTDARMSHLHWTSKIDCRAFQRESSQQLAIESSPHNSERNPTAADILLNDLFVRWPGYGRLTLSAALPGGIYSTLLLIFTFSYATFGKYSHIRDRFSVRLSADSYRQIIKVGISSPIPNNVIAKANCNNLGPRCAR